MWGTQGWNQWALQPSMFQNVPHEEIDWAALAKQWIQMQHVPPADGGSSVPITLHAPPPPPLPPPPAVVPADFQSDVPVPPPPPPFSKPPLLEDPYNRILASDLSRSPLPVSEAGDSSFQVRQSDGAYWTNQEWERSAAHDIDERLWNASSSLDPLAPGQMSKETFDYGHLPDNPPLQMHTVDYNHVSDQFAFNQVYTPESQYDVYWSQVGAAAAAAAVPATVAPTFLKKDRIGGSAQAEEDISHIDAAKRKQLPAWIREGLEKMEQDRLKRLEKERAEKEKAEKLKVKKKPQDSSTKGLNLLHSGEYDKSPPTMPLKSKFDSDSEGEDEVEEDEPPDEAPPSPIEDHRTEEEKYQELMLKVRRMLTEILLEVTNAEMLAIAKEVYQKARLKAPARQLAMPSALPTVATGLRGLASYGSHSDESESEDEDAAGNTDSDEELYRKIREKQKSFAIKEKKIIAELDREEAELREKKLAKAKAEAVSLNKKTEAHISSTKLTTENEDALVHSEVNNTSPVSKTTVRIPFLTDDDQPSPSAREVSPESCVVQTAESVGDNSPEESSGENQTNVAEDSEDNPEEPENSSVVNGSDSDGNNSGKQNDNEDEEIQVLENHSEENEIAVVKEKLSRRSPSENSKKGNGRKTKSSSHPEKPRTKKKRSRSKGSDSSGNKNSRASSRKRSKHKRRSSKSSRRKKRESSTASSSSSVSSSSSSDSSSSSSYRSTSGSKERHKSYRDSKYHSDVRRSDSYERHRTSRSNSSRSRKRSRSRSPTHSSHRRRRSTSRSSYHNSNKGRHWDSHTSESRRPAQKSDRHYSSRSRSRSPDSYRKGRKDYKRSRSRSRSRTPKKYKKRSRSLSSESEASCKRFSARRRYR